MSLQHVGRLDDALLDFQRAVELAPSVDGYSGMAGCLSKLDKSHEALKAYHRALDLRPSDANLYHEYGNLLERMGLLEEALSAYDRGLEFRPNDLRIRAARAYLLHALGRYDAAVIAYNRLGQLDPSRSRRFGRGLCELGRYAEAMRLDVILSERRGCGVPPSARAPFA
jgi:tetratricopeptide (TPR) repeat protein